MTPIHSTVLLYILFLFLLPINWCVEKTMKKSFPLASCTARRGHSRGIYYSSPINIDYLNKRIFFFRHHIDLSSKVYILEDVDSFKLDIIMCTRRARKLYSKEKNNKKNIERVSVFNKPMFSSLSKPINCLRSHILFGMGVGRQASIKATYEYTKFTIICSIRYEFRRRSSLDRQTFPIKH